MLDPRLRFEHGVMARGLADVLVATSALRELSEIQRGSLIRVSIALFRRFERHARAEEREVYPVLSNLLGDDRLAAAMTYDHRAVESGVADLAATDPFDSPRLEALLYGLHALVTAHIDKEEQLVFPLLESNGHRAPAGDGVLATTSEAVPQPQAGAPRWLLRVLRPNGNGARAARHRRV